jgi:hypothetical protein
LESVAGFRDKIPMLKLATSHMGQRASWKGGRTEV